MVNCFLIEMWRIPGRSRQLTYLLLHIYYFHHLWWFSCRKSSVADSSCSAITAKISSLLLLYYNMALLSFICLPVLPSINGSIATCSSLNLTSSSVFFFFRKYFQFSIFNCLLTFGCTCLIGHFWPSEAHVSHVVRGPSGILSHTVCRFHHQLNYNSTIPQSIF